LHLHSTPHYQPQHSLSLPINDTATPETYTLSLHDALPISEPRKSNCAASRRGRSTTWSSRSACASRSRRSSAGWGGDEPPVPDRDRKSTRLNSSHRTISYAVFCLKKKKMKY